uniref:Uncharacterized protein n=1 Tax=Romanomermis culicivorax TaxID=13658 RepID=A0A915K9K0_ROMCU
MVRVPVESLECNPPRPIKKRNSSGLALTSAVYPVNSRSLAKSVNIFLAFSTPSLCPRITIRSIWLDTLKLMFTFLMLTPPFPMMCGWNSLKICMRS